VKRTYIGFALLVILLAVGIAVSCGFSRAHHDLSALLSQAAVSAVAEDWPQAQAFLQEAASVWQRCRNVTAAISDHAPLEEMEQLLARLETLLPLHCPEEFAADCIALSRMAEAMASSQGIQWWNLL
jgi:hypothetical protein